MGKLRSRYRWMPCVRSGRNNKWSNSMVLNELMASRRLGWRLDSLGMGVRSLASRACGFDLTGGAVIPITSRRTS